MTSEATPEGKEWVLESESEYRFELDVGTTLAVKLVSGYAEVFGAELADNSHYYLFGSECRAAIFTWQGCTIEMKYVSDESPMAFYANLHVALEQMRVRALRAIHDPEDVSVASAEPPRVLVLGPENSGKTTLCKILTNYAVRAGQNWSPIFVNVDPSEGGWSVPGAISAAPIHGPLPTYSPANPLGSAATSAPTTIASNALLPLAYWYGHNDTKRNIPLLETIIRTLGKKISERHDLDAEGRASGLIVDTPSSFASGPANSDQRHALIKACIEAFKINIILVVGHEKLNVEMQRAYGDQMSVVKIPKSGGVVELDHAYRERVQQYQLHTYMYGQVIEAPKGISAATLGGEALTDLALSPSSSVISFDDLKLYRIGGEAMAPPSALPIGAARVLSEMQPVLVDLDQSISGILNAVLALLASPAPEEQERQQSEEARLGFPIAGFLVVTSVDTANRKLTILAPNQGSLVGRVAVIGTFEWQD